jgi:NADH-quinone oxidoreductase subunit L
VIAAMAGEQNMDRMGGFRRAMPFTFIAFVVGALALAGLPPFSGLFSKDEILGHALHRGGLYAALGVVGYIGSLLTAFYAGRMVFRTFFGEVAPEAESLERGELAHGEHRNPATGEEEDTEVGFPGPEHHIAEREGAMKVAMAPLALFAIIAGVVGIPGVTDSLEKFLEPTFAESHHLHDVPSESAEWIGIAVGSIAAVVGLGLAFLLYERRAGLTLRIRDRLRPLHDFLANKWYFDDLYERLFVNPSRGGGVFGRTVVESRFVQGFIVGGTTRIVSAGTAFARAIQNGYLRAYAAFLLLGASGLLLYFLIASR